MQVSPYPHPTLEVVVLIALLIVFPWFVMMHFMYLAYHDPLTHLLNRRGFFTCAPVVTSRRCWSVLAIDIDLFKLVNDQLGHDAGDAVLRQLTERVKLAVRQHLAPNGLVARTGGEELLVLLPVSVGMAVYIARCIRRLIARHDFGLDRKITVSIGVAAWRPGEDLTAVTSHADKALYQAKRNGRNRVCVWDAVDRGEPCGRARVRTSLRPAVRRRSRVARFLVDAPRTLRCLTAVRLVASPLAWLMGNLRSAARTRRPTRRVLRTLKRLRGAARAPAPR